MSQNFSSNEELPYSVEAERAVLGGIMLKNDAWDLIAGVVFEEDFLEVDAPINGQKYVLLSFVSPHKILKRRAT